KQRQRLGGDPVPVQGARITGKHCATTKNRNDSQRHGCRSERFHDVSKDVDAEIETAESAARRNTALRWRQLFER
ncbi:MAG TPA: hypothetical protein VI730_10780, partial [Burkholderiales bacterium]|nr:hypothetical protein [Burkholderiales bacterium]